MSRQRLLHSITLSLALGAALAACASAPVQEMSDARQAIRAARLAGGERYTPSTLGEAERLIAQASEQLSQGDYRQARNMALTAKQRAVWARKAALAVQTDD